MDTESQPPSSPEREGSAPEDLHQGELEVRWKVGYRLLLPASPPPPAGFPLLLGLHGYGEDGARLEENLAGLGVPGCARLFPDAPFPLEMHRQTPPRIGYAWYQYTGDQVAFEAALRFGQRFLARLLERVVRQHPIDAGRVALLGYSQGGYLASVAALREPRRYCALIAISTRVKTEILSRELRAASGYPVLLLHGERDRATSLQAQRRSHQVLLEHGIQSQLHVHPGGHRWSADLLLPIERFCREKLKRHPSEGR